MNKLQLLFTITVLSVVTYLIIKEYFAIKRQEQESKTINQCFAELLAKQKEEND